MLKQILFFTFIASNLLFAQDNEVLNKKIDNKYKSLETFARGLHYLESLYVDSEKAKSHKMILDALAGITKELDPHTTLMRKQDFEQLTSDTKGKFGGVGVIVSQEKNNRLIVISPIDDSPAFKAGIKSGDEIIGINNKTLKEISNNVAIDKMRGAPGSTLILSIKRKNKFEKKEFKLIREFIKVQSVRSYKLENKILYVRINSFQATTSDELYKKIKNNSAGTNGLILDLRGNPGGLLDQAVKIVDFFVESGVIVSTVGRNKKRIERELAHKRGTLPHFPIVVLVNGGSASASEIVAGALQDHERALILGTTTFGKGSVQTLLSLPDGSGLKITVARYFTPKDRSIQAKGITPDIIVAETTTADKPTKYRKESELKGHIESKDLSNISKSNSIANIIKKWPSPMQKDNQLVVAYKYLKSWSRFQKAKW